MIGALARVVDGALAFERDKRWPDAGAMADALDRACTDAIGSPSSPLPRLRMVAGERASIHAEPTVPPLEIVSANARPERSDTVTRTFAISQEFGARRARSRTVVRVALGAAGIAAACTIAVGVARSRAASRGIDASTADSKTLQKHLTAASAAWLGARLDVVSTEAHAALQLDDSSAEARLDLVRATGPWPDDADRANFVRAQDVRDLLAPSDRAYLEALAPGMAVPADFQAQAKRLEALHARNPSDLSVSLALSSAWIRVNRAADAAHLLEPLATVSSPTAVVLAGYGDAQAAADDIDGALSSLGRCASDYPAATTCLARLANLDLVEGNCADAERLARRELTVNSGAMDAYMQLASALDGERAPSDEVRHVLDKCIELTAPSAQPLFRARFDEQMALIEGRFEEALAADARISAATAGTDDSDHLDYVNRSIALKAELGRTSEAYDALQDYTASRQDLLRDSYGGDNVMYLNAIATQAKALTWDRWLKLRSARLAAHMDRDDLQDGPQRTWLEYFAIPVHDEASAREALAALPPGTPFLRRSARWPLHDAAIGETLSLTGQLGPATAHFERAAASCTRLDSPIEYVQGLLRFGAHLERTHDNARACETYGRILAMWPANSGSVTASTASARFRAVCSPVPSAKTLMQQ